MATATPTLTLPAGVLAVLEGGTDGKRSSGAAPFLREFVESGEPSLIVDLTEFPNHTAKEMVQNFKNAAQATHHNHSDATGLTAKYSIPGAYFVLPIVVDGALWLINKTVVARLQKEQAEAEAAKAA